MKVLSVAWTIYDSRLAQFTGDCTGGGLVIKNISEYLGRKIDSYLLVGRFELPAMRLGNINIVETQNIAYEPVKGKNNHVEKMLCAFRNALDEIQPDVVNFHGNGEFAQLCIHICIEQKVPYVYTEHLYIGLKQNIKQYERSVEWKKSLYAISDLNVITVSTGTKKKIMDDYPEMPEGRIVVIKNGTDFKARIIESDIKQRYQIENKKVLMCVGTILERKNQLQLVRTFKMLSEEIQENIAIIFCGRDNMAGALQQAIADVGLQEKLIYVGAVSSEEMMKYYSIADGLVMPSLAEGLSIAMLEAISYGLPLIMYSDSECAYDLNDEEVVSFASGRGDEALTDAIEKWYKKEWNREYIKTYSEYFTMERMADDYIQYYKERLLKK